MSEPCLSVQEHRAEEELATIMRTGHRAIILEADEWRPLAHYVLGLLRLMEHRSYEDMLRMLQPLSNSVDKR